MMAKFDDYFDEPLYFSDNTYVVTGKITAEEAAARFSGAVGEDITPSELHKDRVRFGFPPDCVEDRGSLDTPCWYSGAGDGNGTMPIWVFAE